LEAKCEGERPHLRPRERWKDIVIKVDVSGISCNGMWLRINKRQSPMNMTVIFKFTACGGFLH